MKSKKNLWNHHLDSSWCMVKTFAAFFRPRDLLIEPLIVNVPVLSAVSTWSTSGCFFFMAWIWLMVKDASELGCFRCWGSPNMYMIYKVLGMAQIGVCRAHPSIRRPMKDVNISQTWPCDVVNDVFFFKATGILHGLQPEGVDKN